VVRAHERGQIRTIRALERHVAAFDWCVPDLFVAGEARSTGPAPELTDEVRALVAAYRRTTAEGQRALQMIAAQLPTRRGGRQAPPGAREKAPELRASGAPPRAIA
jgi:hypothetical protein